MKLKLLEMNLTAGTLASHYVSEGILQQGEFGFYSAAALALPTPHLETEMRGGGRVGEWEDEEEFEEPRFENVKSREINKLAKEA